MAYPIIYPQGTTLFQVKPDQYYNIFGDFLSAIDSDYCSQDPYFNNHKMCGKFDPTNVVSISYGGPEDVTDPKGAHVCTAINDMILQNRLLIFHSSANVTNS